MQPERPEREPLTARQRTVLEFIRDSIRRRGYPPTLREIGRALGIRSTNGVRDHVRALERKGYLVRDGVKSRALRPVEPLEFVELGGRTRRVPLLGRVPAGQPLLADEHLEDTVEIDTVLLGDAQEVFALRVVGDSMVGDGIRDGDFLFVRKQAVARPGQIVVALVENEATVKRFYPEGDRIRLQPSNPDYEPIFIRREDFRDTAILGVVVGIYRRIAA